MDGVRGWVVNALTVTAAHVCSHPQAASVHFPHAGGEEVGKVKDLWWEDK